MSASSKDLRITTCHSSHRPKRFSKLFSLLRVFDLQQEFRCENSSLHSEWDIFTREHSTVHSGYSSRCLAFGFRLAALTAVRRNAAVADEPTAASAMSSNCPLLWSQIEPVCGIQMRIVVRSGCRVDHSGVTASPHLSEGWRE